MKKWAIAVALLIGCATSQKAFAQTEGKFFNSVAVGVSAGTTGIGLDVATPLGAHFALRGGIDFFPNVHANETVDVSGTYSNSVAGYNYSGSYSSEVEVEGSLKRTQGNVLLNIYPFKRASFFVCGGAYFGGAPFLTLKGHSEDLKQMYSQVNNLGIEVGDYTIPVDQNGDVSGGLKVASFRPYLGLGFGRAVPRHRVGFMLEMGVQFHKTPQVYTDYGNLGDLLNEADNDYTDIINDLTLYPVIRLRLSGRIF